MTDLHPVFKDILSSIAPAAAPARISTTRQDAIALAIANADAHLNNVSIPSYSDLLALVKRTAADGRGLEARLRRDLADAIKGADPAYYGFTV